MANISYSPVQSPQHPINQGIDSGKQKNVHISSLKMKLPGKSFWHAHGKIRNFMSSSRGSSLPCHSTETHNTEMRESSRQLIDRSDTCRYMKLCIGIEFRKNIC